jgi:hypothetical protein
MKWAATSATDGLMYNFKDHGGQINGTTDDSAALNTLISTVNAAGGGTVFIPAGACLLANPVNGKSNVMIRGAGRGVTILKGAAGFPVPANQANGQGTGLIQYVGAFGSSSTSQPIFQNVAITDLSFNMTLVDDSYVNCMNGIFQDYSQMRNALFERLGYIGLTNGQFILLQGLGRITGGWSYDITCRDITAVNGAGTVSTYLNSVNDATATYSSITVDNIYNYVGNISGIVDDRVAIVAAQVGSSRTAPARISNIRVSHIYIEMDPAKTTTGLVNGVKLDTGAYGFIQNVSVRDIFFMGDGSAASQAPFIVLISTSGYVQNYLVDGVYGYKCGAVRCRLGRYDHAPSVVVRNVTLEQSTARYGLVQLYTASNAQGDELITFDSINVQAATTTAAAILLSGGTTAQGASGAINIRGLIAKSCAYGVSTNKTDTGGTMQAGYSSIHISDSNLSAVTTPFSGTGNYTVKNVVGMADTDLAVGRDWTQRP